MCVDGKGSITEDRLCDEQESPILEERCRSDIGCSGSWFTGAWGKVRQAIVITRQSKIDKHSHNNGNRNSAVSGFS